MQLTTCKVLHGNPACGAGQTQGQEWELHHVPTHATQTPRLFPPACTPTLSPGYSQPHFGPHACIPGGGSEAVRTESCTGAGPEPSASLLEPECQTERSADTGLQGYHSQSCSLRPPTHTHTHTHTHTLMVAYPLEGRWCGWADGPGSRALRLGQGLWCLTMQTKG